jgi:hypothetical protein
MIHSAFSDAVAMEQLCGVIAANAVSTGPNAVRHLVSNWIVPSCESLPSFSVAAILSQVAVETMGKSCPLGVRAVVRDCVSSVFIKALGPLLVESLRESEEGVDEGDHSMLDAGDNGNHRTAAITLKAFDSLCKATYVGAVQLQNIFASTNVSSYDMSPFLARQALKANQSSHSCYIYIVSLVDRHIGSNRRCIVFKFRTRH